MKEISLVYPHQLFERQPALKEGRDVLIIEDPLFFGDYYYPLKFHKMKLTFHRASMKSYQGYLNNKKYSVNYMEYDKIKTGVSHLFKWLKKKGYNILHVVETDDFILEKRLKKGASKNKMKIEKYENPLFLNDHEYLEEYFSSKKGYFQHYFYIDQRKKFEILVDNGSPFEGKWSFDADNRKSIPKNIRIPGLDNRGRTSKIVKEAVDYVNKKFKNNPGSNDNFYIPIDHNSSKEWLNKFFNEKFENFGAYQDAIVKEESFLFHSLISPLLNSGLLTPDYVISETVKFIEDTK